MLLIGIHGKARVGKDTVAAHLVRQYGFVKNAFADPLKRAGKEMFGLTDDEAFKDELKEVVIPYWSMSPRTMFQKLGTEGGRNVFGEQLWLLRWKKFYLDYGDSINIVVPDIRFENEAEMIRELGGTLIHMASTRETPLTVATQAHSSEAGVTFVFGLDERLNNDGTFTQLYAKVDQIMTNSRAPGEAA